MNDIIEMTSDLETLEKRLEKKYNKSEVYFQSSIAFMEGKHKNTIKNWRKYGLKNKSRTKRFTLEMDWDGSKWYTVGEEIINFKLKINT